MSNNKKQKENTTPKDKEKNTNTLTMKDGHQVSLLDINLDQTVEEQVNKEKETGKSLFLNRLVKEELNRREKLLTKAFEEYEKTLNTLKSIKPDQEYFSRDGVKTSSYSSAKFQEKRKAVDYFDKLKSAIDLAWNKNNFQELNKLFQK